MGPDVLMVLIARLYFTECYLYTQSFVDEMKEMQMNDIINGEICQKYNEMNHKIKMYGSLFYIWIINLCIQLILSSWHSVSTYMHPYNAITEIWIIYNSMEGLVYFLVVLFILWPVMAMNQKLSTLMDIINEKLDQILKTRLHFHDDAIMDHLLNAILQKQHSVYEDDVQWQKMSIGSTVTESNNSLMSENSTVSQRDMNELYHNLILQSKQEMALGVLNRMKYLVKKKSCHFKMIL